MELVVNEREIRVLGCLMEKAMTTPEYYPLSLNALTNACNQKSNRDPVVAWDEDFVQETVEALEAKGLVNVSAVGRVPKYEETLTRSANMVASEAAVLCVLLLRGPQTPGAIRSRTERLHAFAGLDDLQETLDRLCEWGLIRRLGRSPGHKESRYTYRLAGEAAESDDSAAADDPASLPPAGSAADDRLSRLEDQIDALRDEVAELRAAFDAFRRQFE